MLTINGLDKLVISLQNACHQKHWEKY